MGLLRIEEACRYCGVSDHLILEFIQEKWITPRNVHEILLDQEDLARIRLIRELKEEFGVNDEGIPIILNLLDQLNRMHIELEKLNSTS